jgi:hypothetical protein
MPSALRVRTIEVPVLSRTTYEFGSGRSLVSATSCGHVDRIVRCSNASSSAEV